MKAFLIHNLTTGKYVEHVCKEYTLWNDINNAAYFDEHGAIDVVEFICKDNLDGYIFTIIPIWV